MQVKPYVARDAGAGTSLTLLAGAAGKRSSIHGLMLSTDTEGEYIIEIGTEEAFRFYFGDNGGIASPTMYPFYLEGDEFDADIVLTKPGAANTSVTMFAGQA
jgi:hypothetical protein